MSNIDKMLEIACTNKDLFVDLNEKDAETISGGVQEVFTIKNETKYRILFYLDGIPAPRILPNEQWPYTANQGGSIVFDRDGRDGIADNKSYNLSDGRIYVFRDNKDTPGNPYDIELYKIA